MTILQILRVASKAFFYILEMLMSALFFFSLQSYDHQETNRFCNWYVNLQKPLTIQSLDIFSVLLVTLLVTLPPPRRVVEGAYPNPFGHFFSWFGLLRQSSGSRGFYLIGKSPYHAA